MVDKLYKSLGLVGRFKPLHYGGAALLESACENSELVKIGIGSSNKYNLRNPFTAEESKDMIDLFLKDKFNNYEIIFLEDFGHIPEFNDGKKWAKQVRDKFGQLDVFVTGNDYVDKILKTYYKTIHPCDLIPKEKWIKLRSTEVRFKLASFVDWESLVPSEVVEYLLSNDLDQRFRKEFGLETLSSLSSEDYTKEDTAEEEKLHVQIK